MIHRSVGAAILVAVFSAQAFADQSGTLDAMLTDRLAALPKARIVVGIIDGTRTDVVVRGDGASADTPFEIGGLAEVFVATVLADMVGKGELTLRDPVARHLPGVPVPTHNGKSITLEDLAMHRASLPRSLPGLTRGDQHRYAAYTPERLARFLDGYDVPHDIGSRYERSPLGIGLLAAAMSTRAGKPLDVLLQERVIAPLGLQATQIKDGALASTARDVMKFASANLAHDGPLAVAFAEAQSSRGAAGPRGESLGLGWRIRHSGPRQILWASGASGGHQAFMAFEREAGRAVVALHDQPVSVDDIGFNVLEQVHETARPVDTAALAAFAGEYEIKRGLRVVVRVAGTKLAARVADEPESTLTQDSEVRFVFDDADARLTFVRDANGLSIGLMLHRNGQHIAARRIK